MKWGLWIFALVVAAAGCGGPSESAGDSSQAPTGAAAKTVEVQAFKGGYGIDFYQSAADEFAQKNPGVTVKVDGTPRVWETLRPRLIAGDHPDLMFPGWGMDHWALADEGQLMTLDEALNSKIADGQTWRDTFEPQLLALGQRDGKQYVLPYYFAVMGWWYDPKVFEKHGWKVPTTYEELLALGEKIKAKGLAPITFQGQYPDYMTRGMLLPWAYRLGGPEVMRAADNLEPGAWKHPAIVQAATMITELNAKGFFQKGAVALSHTDAQMEFLLGRAAMIPCGTWLKAEMAASMPKEAAMAYFLPPIPSQGPGDPSAVMIKIEPWMVPAKAKNPDLAIELFKHMTSLDVATRFVTEKSTFMAIKGANDVELDAELKGAAEAFKASKAAWAPGYIDSYPELHKEIGNALTALVNGQLDPSAFAERVEKKAQEIRSKR